MQRNTSNAKNSLQTSDANEFHRSESTVRSPNYKRERVSRAKSTHGITNPKIIIDSENIKLIAENTKAKLKFNYGLLVKNKFTDEAQEQSLKEITRLNIVDAIEAKKLKSASFGNLIGLVHPHVDEETLFVINDFIHWLFLYDDSIELEKKEKITASHERTLAIVNGDDILEPDDQLARWFHSIIAKVYEKFPSPLWRARFIKDLQDYCDATLWEFNNRQLKRMPPIDEYRRKRLHTSATLVMFRFVMPPDDIPDEIFFSNAFQDLETIAANIVNCTNDIFSAPKEAKAPFNPNLVSVFKAAYEISYEKAFEFAAKELNKYLTEFDELSEKIPYYDGEYTDAVKTYVDGIRLWFNAYHSWGSRSRRYS